MTTAVCVWAGDRYGPEYVARLRRELTNRVTGTLDLVCFTDRPRDPIAGVEFREMPVMEFKPDRLWWYKIYIFSEQSGLAGDCIYFDLDVMILRPIDEMLNFNADFVILQDFNRAFRKNYPVSNSSIIKWRHELYRGLWTNFLSDIGAITTKYRGDQDYITAAVGYNRTWWPASWACSFKWEWLMTPEYMDPMVLVFHGEPKPEDFDFDLDRAREAKYDRIRTDKIYR